MANPWVIPAFAGDIISNGVKFAKVVDASIDSFPGGGEIIAIHVTQWYDSPDKAYRDDTANSTMNKKVWDELELGVVPYTCSI